MGSKCLAEIKKTRDIQFRITYTDTKKAKISIKSYNPSTIVEEYIKQVYDGTIDKDTVIKRALLVLKNTKTV